MAQVIAKKTTTNGYVLGVNFVNGKADTEAPAALAFFNASADYDVDEGSKPTPAPAKPKD